MGRPRKIQTENMAESIADTEPPQDGEPVYSHAMVKGNVAIADNPALPHANPQTVFSAAQGWRITVPHPGVLRLQRGEFDTMLMGAAFQVII